MPEGGLEKFIHGYPWVFDKHVETDMFLVRTSLAWYLKTVKLLVSVFCMPHFVTCIHHIFKCATWPM